MPLHLVKLCVGVDSVDELEDWQRDRLKGLRRARKTPELVHRTRQMPRRRDELLAGGSVYWVIKGMILVRQPIADLRPAEREGVPCCDIVLAADLVPTRPQARRAFQGWRYLQPEDAPEDIARGRTGRGSEPIRAALIELRLIDP
jgi:hypothetical protein